MGSCLQESDLIAGSHRARQKRYPSFFAKTGAIRDLDPESERGGDLDLELVLSSRFDLIPYGVGFPTTGPLIILLGSVLVGHLWQPKKLGLTCWGLLS